MPWSDQNYDPDGPWHAISVQLGSNRQKIDLYPGDRWASTIIINTLCSNKSLSSTCYAERAGTFSINESDTAVTLGSVLRSASDKWRPIAGYRRQGVLADSVSFGPVVPNVSMNAIYDAYQTYPDGANYSVSVGFLSLGALKLTHSAVDYTYKFNLLAGWLYSKGGVKKLPSYSYGMHVGSVNPDILDSFILGGYERNGSWRICKLLPHCIGQLHNGKEISHTIAEAHCSIRFPT